MNSVMLMARWISPSESLRVLPSSRVRRRASSSLCSCMICVALKRILPRFGAGVLRQPGNAARAAAMASFISSRVESGMRATTSSVVAGVRRSTIFDDFDSTHWPLMKFLQNSVAATAVAMHDSGIRIRRAIQTYDENYAAAVWTDSPRVQPYCGHLKCFTAPLRAWLDTYIERPWSLQ